MKKEGKKTQTGLGMSSTLIDDMRYIVGDLPIKTWWKGVCYTGTATGIAGGSQLVNGGVLDLPVMSVGFTRTDLPGVPQRDDEMIVEQVDGQRISYAVKDVDLSQDGVAMVVNLKTDEQ